MFSQTKKKFIYLWKIVKEVIWEKKLNEEKMKEGGFLRMKFSISLLNVLGHIENYLN